METVIVNSAGTFDIRDLCGYGIKFADRTHDAVATAAMVREANAVWDADPAASAKVRRSLAGLGPAPQRAMLYEVARKVLGMDVPNTPQEAGDCVSWGAKHGIEYVQFAPILNGSNAEWTQVFSPYLWGMGRLAPDCGNNRLGRQDGSVGAWQAKAVTEYGCLALNARAADGSTLPAYSGQVARQWGNRPGPDPKWVEVGKTHLVRSTAKVATLADLRAALGNYYPVTVAWSFGYTMKPQGDGFHHRQGRWGHQTCFIGYDQGDGDKVPENYIVLNSWGDVHGHLTDFRTGESLPIGVLRVTPQDAQAMLDEDDSFAYSQFDEFVAQPLSGPIVVPDAW